MTQSINNNKIKVLNITLNIFCVSVAKQPALNKRMGKEFF